MRALLPSTSNAALRRLGVMLEWMTLSWNVVVFIALASYLLVQSSSALSSNHHSRQSLAGIAWTGVTAIVMFALAAGKRKTGVARNNPVLVTEGRVTFIDVLLAIAVLMGLALDLLFGWWWADPVAGLVIVYYAIREAVHILRPAAG